MFELYEHERSWSWVQNTGGAAEPVLPTERGSSTCGATGFTEVEGDVADVAWSFSFFSISLM